jgi:hypothetical protein
MGINGVVSEPLLILPADGYHVGTFRCMLYPPDCTARSSAHGSSDSSISNGYGETDGHNAGHSTGRHQQDDTLFLNLFMVPKMRGLHHPRQHIAMFDMNRSASR